MWGGVSPSPPGRGLCPLPRKFFDFGCQYGEFWCILDGIFTVQLPVLHAKPTPIEMSKMPLPDCEKVTAKPA